MSNEKDYCWIVLLGHACKCGAVPEAFCFRNPISGSKVRCSECERVGRLKDKDGALVIKWD